MQSQIARRRACVTGVRTCQSSFDRNRPQQEGGEMPPVTFVSWPGTKGPFWARAPWAGCAGLRPRFRLGERPGRTRAIGLLHRRAFAHFGGRGLLHPGIVWPISRPIALNRFAINWGDDGVIAVPLSFARPVRPMRWT